MPPAASASAAAVEGKAAAPVQDAALASCEAAAEQPEQQPAEAPGAADPPGPRRGSGALPLGHSAVLGEAAQWLVLLVVAAARARLPPQGLSLLADLAQLLFCRAGPTAPPGCNLVQVCLTSTLWRHTTINGSWFMRGQELCTGTCVGKHVFSAVVIRADTSLFSLPLH